MSVAHRPQSARGLMARLRGLLSGLHRNDSGATLTEFVIMLPIFLIVFDGVLVLGQFTRKSSELPVRAYKQTFEQALRYQKDFYAFGWNDQPQAASVDALTQLNSVSTAHNRSTAVKWADYAEETAAYGGLGLSGTPGESYARVKPIAAVIDIKGCEGNSPGDYIYGGSATNCVGLKSDNILKPQLKGWVGNAKYATDLLNDSVFNGGGFGGGFFSALNNIITHTGIRPALAAGVRYGTVSGRVDDDYTFAGQTMHMNAHFSTLVPPGTTGDGFCPLGQGPRCDALRATAVARLTMQGEDYYKELPGIRWSQPLHGVGSKSFNVPDYPDYH